jgi:AmmeMemoRadiSam system protein A
MPPGAPHRASLLAPAGTFVTLYTTSGERLRGCIGTATETQPLFKAIQEMTIAAASRDPRFDPVRVDEVRELMIEVSVLGERRRIAGPDEIELGRHGLCVSVDGLRGLYLPSVPVEQRWDAPTFLARTCEKAGAPPDAWRLSAATVEVFETQAFNDRDYPPISAIAMIRGRT